MKLFIKKTILGAALLALTACGIFGAGVKSPCSGLYCLDVTAAGVPGEALATAGPATARVVGPAKTPRLSPENSW